MKNPGKHIRLDRSEANTTRRFKLFLAGEEPNSQTAKWNFEKIRSLLDPPCEFEIIDVLENFQVALAHGVVVTPTLVQVYPAPGVTILGNLNDIARVLSALGIKETADEN